MSSEWLKVMLEEIARKKAEAAQALQEERRREEQRRADRQALEGVIQSGECAPRKEFGDAE
jgi:septal ring factor EnvC (AmiA/AmiB activator)